MSWRCSSTTNKGLVQCLKAYGLIKSPSVEIAMSLVDRQLFCRDPDSAYVDAPQPIGFGQTISAPHMHASALDLLSDYLQPGMTALDVGSGSGYLTACMAMMVAPPDSPVKGRVFGIEYVKELYEQSIINLRKDPLLSRMLDDGTITIINGDGWQGVPDYAPFNSIHVGAAAEEIPKALEEQLASPGRMVIPVGPQWDVQYLTIVDKDANGNISEETLFGVRYVPLVNPSRIT